MDVSTIIHFIARECELQMSGERSVANMWDAWTYAIDVAGDKDYYYKPDVGDIIHMGTLIEPVKNHFGFRTCGVQVGWDVKPNWQTVPDQITRMVSNSELATPAEYFKEFEEIHPFVDGNGRTGQILFNWLNGSLDSPVWAPDFWGDARRLPGSGAPS